MEPLIITCCATDGILTNPSEYPGIKTDLVEIADSLREAYEAGATVAHIHGPFDPSGGGQPTIDSDAWERLAVLIRERCPEMIIQFGVAGAPLEQRRRHFESSEILPEMMSICLTEHDYNFDGLELNIMHPRPELEEYARLCREYEVTPEWETFHLGALFNLSWLIERDLVEPPYWLTLFFGASGGVWTPPTLEELQHRVRNLPDGTIWQASVWTPPMGTASTQAQIHALTMAIMLGGHVRIGVEDNPRYWDDRPAKSNAELVQRIVRIGDELGRDVATPSQARELIGTRKS